MVVIQKFHPYVVGATLVPFTALKVQQYVKCIPTRTDLAAEFITYCVWHKKTNKQPKKTNHLY